MESGKGGSSTRSYKDAVSSRSISPTRNSKDGMNYRNRDNEKETDGTRTKENNSTKEKEEEYKNFGSRDKKQKGPCKPKAEITPQVILNDPALQEHMEHMGTYAIICKFMGLWPTKKALQTWIKYHWKPKGSIYLHLGSKGFFTIVFSNIEDKDRIFEGGPYFFCCCWSLYETLENEICPGEGDFLFGSYVGEALLSTS